MLIAITRKVSPAITRCELTHLERQSIDLQTAIAQHVQYEQALQSLGVEVISLPAEPDLPDSVFVEDAALVLDELALLTHPGADSRKPEVESISRSLSSYRQLITIQSPGSLDGGDILQVGKNIYVGISTRSNVSAIQQMETCLKPFGYQVKGVKVTGCLHLKSAVTQVAEDALLINPAWIDKEEFDGYKLIEVHPLEIYGANAVRVNQILLYQPGFPCTGQRLEAAGLKLKLVDASELGKAEGALTCCSLIFTA
ncbi:MAG: dimethylargininase [Chloroflexi bacterium GWB2_49_20]|nr:MAG: dimethylargininase [Chloroflexi bacterium GWB2_49_20]OGN80431.1 MAG: dimethylargininase [Chloroflexi bacterium GWC2_49_37]OGN84255.1 MAG: dimethylargininase [Chloroflexi bacterium GWD2_49_16]